MGGMMRTEWVLILALAAACTSTTGPGPGATLAATPNLDQPFQLRAGERAFIDEASLYVRFLDVVADSRCPSDPLIQCIWEGDGAILVEVAPVNGDTLADTLHTTLDPKILSVGGVVLEFVQLDPYPATTTAIPLKQYVATFVVQRAA
jgi:hypothetical protein